MSYLIMLKLLSEMENVYVAIPLFAATQSSQNYHKCTSIKRHVATVAV